MDQGFDEFPGPASTGPDARIDGAPRWREVLSRLLYRVARHADRGRDHWLLRRLYVLSIRIQANGPGPWVHIEPIQWEAAQLSALGSLEAVAAYERARDALQELAQATNALVGTNVFSWGRTLSEAISAEWFRRSSAEPEPDDATRNVVERRDDPLSSPPQQPTRSGGKG